MGVVKGGGMRGFNSAEFRAWLDTRSGIDPDAERSIVGCEGCGIAEAVCPFIHGYCYFCLGILYGQFIKCQQLVLWLDMNLPLSAHGGINDRAEKLLQLGSSYGLPRADESDEEFSARSQWYAER
jgi:hypothetical protein